MKIIITEEQKNKLFIPKNIDFKIISIINKINNEGYLSLSEEEKNFYNNEISSFIMLNPEQYYQKKIKLNQKYLYHYSPIKLRNTILKNGLIPKLGEMTLKGFGIDIDIPYRSTTLIGKPVGDFWHRIKIVNLAKSGVDVIPKPKLFFFLNIPKNGYFYDKRDLWRIDLTGLNVDFYVDDNLSNAVCCNDRIPPNNLELIN